MKVLPKDKGCTKGDDFDGLSVGWCSGLTWFKPMNGQGLTWGPSHPIYMPFFVASAALSPTRHGSPRQVLASHHLKDNFYGKLEPYTLCSPLLVPVLRFNASDLCTLYHFRLFSTVAKRDSGTPFTVTAAGSHPDRLLSHVPAWWPRPQALVRREVLFTNVTS